MSTGPTCCRACRDDRSGSVGAARRWALTEKGAEAIGTPKVRMVPVLTPAALKAIAAEHEAVR